jgi:hypothetical protein
MCVLHESDGSPCADQWCLVCCRIHMELMFEAREMHLGGEVTNANEREP